jgi:hypothetical protein
MKKLVTLIFTLLSLLALAAAVYAAGPGSGKVTKVEGDKVTVTMEGAVPAWAKKGATVSVLGGAPKVLSVNGKEVTLRMSKAKAATVKVDTSVTLTKGGEMQGC